MAVTSLQDAHAQWLFRGRSRNVCPPGTMPVYPGDAYRSPSTPLPSTTTDPSTPPAPTDPNSPPNDPNAPADPNALTTPDQVFNQPNNALQAASSPSSLAPNTIGDFFGATPVSTQAFGPLGSVNTTAAGPYAALAGRQKLVEHESPLPRDRVFLNYSYFDNVPLTTPGINVQRYTVGAEKTLLDGMASITVRVPLSRTLNSDIHTATENGLSDETFEMGNINIGAKLLVAQTENCALSIGTTVRIPTADDIRIYANDTDVETLRYENKSVHVMPYLGLVFTPTDRLFTQMIFQLDFDTNGNPVKVLNGAGALETVGRAQDANFAYVTWSTGYWLIKEQCCGRVQHGLAPMVELHYNRSIKNFDQLSGTTSDGITDFGIGTNVPGGVGADEVGSFEALNITLGLFMQMTEDTTLTLGYATPLGGLSKEDQFNGEFRVLFNYYFGRR